MAHIEDKSAESLIHNSNNLFNSAFLLLKEFIELAHLEAKLSCQNLIIALSLVFFSAMLAISSWIALSIAAGLYLHDYGLSWLLSSLIIALVNIGILSFCVGMIKYYLKNIGFANTLKNFNFIKERSNEQLS
ncbi:MAG: hypothetical protein K0S29_877 [Gammaproteobacteria bacterium]|jgi:apolipoprotein N-acyltransferase|nr:hypothetical protein [Gammaproteobacteria bacterium]